MGGRVREVLRGESGAALVEYGIIALAVLTIVAIAITAWGEALANWFQRMVDIVNGFGS